MDSALIGEKTKVILFSPVYRDFGTFNANGTSPTESATLVGITIDDGRNWSKHIDHLCATLSSITFAFRTVVSGWKNVLCLHLQRIQTLYWRM